MIITEKKIASVTMCYAAFFVACAASATEDAPTGPKSTEDLGSLLDHGPWTVHERGYELPPEADPNIVDPAGLAEPTIKVERTQLAGRIFAPGSDQKSASDPRPLPLVVILHGGRETCSVELGDGWPRVEPTDHLGFDQDCPEGMFEAPHWRGFDRLARLLASHGFVVVSINANRSIGRRAARPEEDLGHINRRAFLIFKTLEQLHAWDRDGVPMSAWRREEIQARGVNNPSTPLPVLRHRIDFNQVGLVGHSRGGDAVLRTAEFQSELRTESPMPHRGHHWFNAMYRTNFQAVVRIAASGFGDGVSSFLSMPNTALLTLIAGCDGSSSMFDSTRTHRLFANVTNPARTADSRDKAVFAMWGANHDFFNETWQNSDTTDTCGGDQPALWTQEGKTRQLGELAPELIEQILSSVEDPETREASRRAYNEGFRVSKSRNREVQTKLGAAVIASFVRAHVGNGSPALAQIFDPRFPLPPSLATFAGSISREHRALDQERVVWPRREGRIQPRPGSRVAPLHEFSSDARRLFIGTRLKKKTSELMILPSSNSFAERLTWEGAAGSFDLPLATEVAPNELLYVTLTRRELCAPEQDPCRPPPVRTQLRWVYPDGTTSKPLLPNPLELRARVAPSYWSIQGNDARWRSLVYDSAVTTVTPNAEGQLPTTLRFEFDGKGSAILGDVWLRPPGL